MALWWRHRHKTQVGPVHQPFWGWLGKYKASRMPMCCREAVHVGKSVSLLGKMQWCYTWVRGPDEEKRREVAAGVCPKTRARKALVQEHWIQSGSLNRLSRWLHRQSLHLHSTARPIQRRKRRISTTNCPLNPTCAPWLSCHTCAATQQQQQQRGKVWGCKINEKDRAKKIISVISERLGFISEV